MLSPPKPLVAGLGRLTLRIFQSAKLHLLFEKSAKKRTRKEAKPMQKEKNKRYSWIWILLVLVFVCVAASTFVLMSILREYHPDDSGAISLLPEATEDSSASSGSSGSVAAPSFEVFDSETVWGTDTNVELFRATYENGEQLVTVEGSNGEKVIAPGTTNTYVFKLKNTGNVALDYDVEVEAFFTPEEVEIPVESRIKRYDGEWMLGGEAHFDGVELMNGATDRATLGKGCYTYYTLEWQWPFEGDDALDTALGNLAKEQELLFTLKIKTTATESDDPNAEGGILAPYTGDSGANTLMWGILAGTAFIILIILIFGKKRDRRR